MCLPCRIEGGGVVVDVEDADLAIVLFQYHDGCVHELIHLHIQHYLGLSGKL